MKAAQFHPKALKIGLEEIPIPAVNEDEILIKTIAASICHSDMMLIDGSYLVLPSENLTIGHEATGEVIDFGSQVTGFAKGDQIGFTNAYHACFECPGCARHYLFCQKGLVKMQGFATKGYLQEYSAIDYKTAVVLPNGMDARISAPIFCAGITAYQAVQETKLENGEWLAVVGCGGLGQLAIRYAKAMGLKVLAIDVEESILALAKQAAVDHTCNSRTMPNCLDLIHKITQGGAAAVLVFTAVKAGYDFAPKTLKVGGTLVCVGCPPEEVSFNAMEISLGKFSIRGANNSAHPALLRECAEFTFRHGIQSPSRFFALNQIEEMIELMEKANMKGTRLVVEF